MVVVVENMLMQMWGGVGNHMASSPCLEDMGWGWQFEKRGAGGDGL